MNFYKNINIFLMGIFTLSFEWTGYAAAAQSPSSPIELEYGRGKKVSFYQSDELIAAKIHSTRPQEDQEKSLFGSQSTYFTLEEEHQLEGFKIFRYKDHKSLEKKIEEITSSSQKETPFAKVFHTNVKDKTPFIPSGILNLKFKERVDSESCSDILERYNLEIRETLDGPNNLFVEVVGGPDPIQTSKELQRVDEVEWAVPEFVTPLRVFAYPPTNPQIEGQWHLENLGNHRGTSIGLLKGSDARVKAAWNFMDSVGINPLGSEQVKIAIIDDGFDTQHPNLINKIVDPWDFARNSPDVSPQNGDWHGTAVAGVAAADDAQGPVVGVAPRAKIMPIRWGSGLSDRSIRKWFHWARDHKADIISCSWGAKANYFPLSPFVEALLTQVVEQGREGKGIPIFFAAGNDNQNVNDPTGSYLNGFATHPKVMAIAASNSRDKKSHYSNYGKEIAFTAPSSGAGGMKILTSDVRGNDGYNKGYDYCDDFGGTSSSCPLAAGVAALMLSVNSKISASEIREILESTARPIGPFKVDLGKGCVNAEEAVKEAHRRSNLP